MGSTSVYIVRQRESDKNSTECNNKHERVWNESV